MADQTLPDELIDPPPRFGVRSVLFAMTVLALLAACSAPLVRDWEPERWQRLGVATLATAAGVLLGMSLWRWKAKRAQRKAGEPLVWLVMVDGRTPDSLLLQWSAVLPYVLIPLMVVAMSLLAAPLMLKSAPRLASYVPFTLIMGLNLGLPCWSLTRLHLARGVALGEGGAYLPAGARFYKWSKVAMPSPPAEATDNHLRLRLGGPFAVAVTAAVPEEQRAAVESLLAEKLPPRQL